MKIAKSNTILPYCLAAFLIYFISILGYYIIGHEQIQRTPDYEVNLAAASTDVVNVPSNWAITQVIEPLYDNLTSISLLTSTGEEIVGSGLHIQIKDHATSELLMEADLTPEMLMDNQYSTFHFDDAIHGVSGRALFVTFTASAPTASIWIDESAPGKTWLRAEEIQTGSLCMIYTGFEYRALAKYYWPISILIGLLVSFYLLTIYRKDQKGIPSLGSSVFQAFTRYRFLLKQLIMRDFKMKYKRSMLGMFWSFLNPLFTMLVQYVIFSTLFSNSISFFPVYLLIGIVFFQFFTESSTMGLLSVVSNAPLITKVYVPKYIFPISRVLSSSINLLISLIPLFFVSLFMSIKITPALLLLPVVLFLLIVFCMGMSLFLSSAMVYFRDTQFLWNVICLLWTYATPIFYPESILPDNLQIIFKINPMYHFIRFTRMIVLEGTAPAPQAVLLCIIAAVVPFIIGCLVFKFAQRNFINKI